MIYNLFGRGAGCIKYTQQKLFVFNTKAVLSPNLFGFSWNAPRGSCFISLLRRFAGKDDNYHFDIEKESRLTHSNNNIYVTRFTVLMYCKSGDTRFSYFCYF